ncbi:hypothetical protein RND61_14225 [Streptomyces sp. TRM76323]|uniref:Uncharacterized protein n=1 Tax=Streptomyces tamarix TaxID=3078565 RepID=A0ABU3QKC6_9ACTN|nr:hypothetical protein [Streptomyces tamarix]MDT9683220.1 hypothetical protein [Streptomyces tamarix]
MADERYEWLDHEAAERLLRGEPVDADDDYAQWQVERLSEVLDSARGGVGPLAPGPSGELPGEEAALVAFRAARSAHVTKSQVATGSDLGSVRMGTALRPLRPARPRGWTRPARWGLAASVAGLAVGGVAVAASTGVLPTFGGHKTPLPAASASAPTTPVGPAVVPPGSTGPRASTGPGGPTSSTSPAPSTGANGAATVGGGSAGGDDGTSGGRTDPGDWGRTVTRAPDGTWPARATQACRDFRDGRLDTARRRQLELAANADSGSVRRFCDQVLAGGGRQSGNTSAGTGAVGGTGTSAGTGAVGGLPGAGTGTGTGVGKGGSGSGGTGGDSDNGDPDTARGGQGTTGKNGGGGSGGATGKGASSSGTSGQKPSGKGSDGKRS